MKTLILFSLLTLAAVTCFSQLSLVNKKRVIRLEASKILGVQTDRTNLQVPTYIVKYARGKTGGEKTVYLLEKVHAVKTVADSMLLPVTIIQHYQDSISGEIYSNTQVKREWAQGNYRGKPILQDTIFQFAIADIRQLRIQTKEPRSADGMGIFGMLTIGTAVTIYSAVTVIKGNGNGYYGLALGTGMLGLGSHWIKQSRWQEDFTISSKKWSIQSN
ncbi:MAG: hypothetical protein EOO06_19265 [Chitinophagaceae bacterium]|nr:MAG: hypothetical protein EOO06_19265 [Chitinophagaceae bacterium]